MSETNDLRLMMLALGKDCKNVRIFRNNTGKAYQANKVLRVGNTITLTDYRVVEAGLCVGSSDLIGLTMITITPDMIGKQVAVFTAIEGKTNRGVASEAQNNFINMVNNFGGIAGVARGEQQAVELIKKHELSNGL